MELTPSEEPIVVVIQTGFLKRVPLGQCIKQLRDIKEALARSDYERVISLRGKPFQDSIEIYRTLNKLDPFEKQHLKVGLLNTL
jgi:hypothetical protein